MVLGGSGSTIELVCGGHWEAGFGVQLDWGLLRGLVV